MLVSKGAPRKLDKKLSAVQHIQKAWRGNFRNAITHTLVNDFKTKGATISKVRSLSFEDMVAFLRERDVIKSTGAALTRIVTVVNSLYGCPRRMLPANLINVRVFLAASMIAYTPNQVFESMGALEHAVMDAAIVLVQRFDDICSRIMANPKNTIASLPVDLTKDFPIMLYDYLARFKAWKIPDEIKLTGRIKHALNALHDGELHIHPDEPVDAPLRIEFKTQINRLTSKLEQIGDFHRARARRQAGGDAVQPPVYHFPDRLTNEQLAHELVIDPTFRINGSGGHTEGDEAFQRVRDTFHTAFFNTLTDDLNLATPSLVRVTRVLQEIKEGLLEIAGDVEADAINQDIDMDLITQMNQNGAFQWPECIALFQRIYVIVQRVQMPARAEDSRRAWNLLLPNLAIDRPVANQASAFSAGLSFSLDRVNAMRIDSANDRLLQIVPVISVHGYDYERGKFATSVRNGVITTNKTTSWIRDAVVGLVQSGDLLLQPLLDGRATAFESVLTHAATYFVITPGLTLTYETFPEVIRMDIRRFVVARIQINYVASASALMMSVVANPSFSEAAVRIMVDIVTALTAFFTDAARTSFTEEEINALILPLLPSLEDQNLFASINKQNLAPADTVSGLM